MSSMTQETAGPKRPSNGRFALLSGAILFLITTVYVFQSRPGEPVAVVDDGPLRCPAAEYDFGTAPAGTVVNHTFLVENAGDDPIQIQDVRTTCSCTSTIVGSPVVAAHDTLAVPVKLTVGRTPGPQQQRVTLDYGQGRAVELLLTGEGQPRFRVEPSEIYLSLERPSATVELECTGGEFDIKDLKASASDVNVTVDDDQSTARRAVVEITLQPAVSEPVSESAASRRERVFIVTNDAFQNLVTIPVSIASNARSAARP